MIILLRWRCTSPTLCIVWFPMLACSRVIKLDVMLVNRSLRCNYGAFLLKLNTCTVSAYKGVQIGEKLWNLTLFLVDVSRRFNRSTEDRVSAKRRQRPGAVPGGHEPLVCRADVVYGRKVRYGTPWAGVTPTFLIYDTFWLGPPGDAANFNASGRRNSP